MYIGLLSSDKTGELIVAGTFALSTPCPEGDIVALLPAIDAIWSTKSIVVVALLTVVFGGGDIFTVPLPELKEVIVAT